MKSKSKAEAAKAKKKTKAPSATTNKLAQPSDANQSTERPPFIAGESKLVPIGDLVSHPMNGEIYGAEADAKFVNAVKHNGIYSPLLVTTKNIVISGGRRLDAAKQSGIREVPVIVFDSEDEHEILHAMVAANFQRVKTKEQIAREFKVLLEVETERAHKRMGQGVENLPQDMLGKARDLAGSRLGISGKTGAHAAAVIDKIDQLNADSKIAEAKDLTRRLNKSFHSAFKRLQVLNQAEDKNESPKPNGQPDEGAALKIVAPLESKSDLITRIQENIVDGIEVWPIGMLRIFEAALINFRRTFEKNRSNHQEAA